MGSSSKPEAPHMVGLLIGEPKYVPQFLGMPTKQIAGAEEKPCQAVCKAWDAHTFPAKGPEHGEWLVQSMWQAPGPKGNWPKKEMVGQPDINRSTTPIL